MVVRALVFENLSAHQRFLRGDSPCSCPATVDTCSSAASYVPLPPPEQQQVVLASEFSDSDDSDSSSAEEDGALITDSGKGNARRRMENKNLCATDAEVRIDACADANIGDINGGGSTRLSTGASKRLRSADTRKIRSLPRRANMEPAAPPPAKTRKPSCTFHDVATTSTTTTPPSPPVSTSAAHDSPEAKANGLSLSVAPSISPPSLPGPTFPSSPRAAARSPSHLFPTTRQHLPDALGQSMVMAGSAMTTPTPMKSQSIATLATTTSTPSAALSSATRNNDHGGDGNEDRRVRSGGRLGINSESSRTDGVGSVGRRAHENEKGGTLGGGRFGRRGSCPFSVDRRRGESAGGMTARMASPASPRESPTTENRGVGSDAPVDTIVPNRRYKRDRTEGEQQQHRQGTSVSPANQVSPSAVHRASTDVGKPSKRHTKKNSEKKKKKRMRGAESSAGGRPGGSGGAAAIDDIFDSIC